MRAERDLGAVAAHYKLKLKSLKFLSAVDYPAQAGLAQALILKRNGTDEHVSLTARVTKLVDLPDTNGELGLVFGYAFGSSRDGGQTPFIDLQDDAIEPDFLKAAMDFMVAGAPTDVNHDNDLDGRVVFAWPLLPDINEAMGISADVVGLAVAVKTSKETYAAFKRGELTGFSLEGKGERTKVAGAARKGDDPLRCSACSSYMAKEDKSCPACGASNDGYGKRVQVARAQPDASHFVETSDQILCVHLGKRAPVHYTDKGRSDVLKAVWSTAYVDDLPDSAFLYVEGGGKKDDDGKTQPRSLRHFPYKDVNGKVDIAHLRDATGRIPQSSLPASLKERLQQKAEKLLAAQHSDEKRLAKRMLMTSVADGHQHLLNDGDDGDGPSNYGTTEYAQDMNEADQYSSGAYHCHPWVRAADGQIQIGMSYGHTHTVEDPDAADDAAGKRARNSTPQHVPLNAGGTREESTMDTAALKKLLDEALAKIARLEKKAELSDAQRALYKTLDKAGKDAFLAKSVADRDAAVKAAIVYTAKDGTLHFEAERASFAKRIDDQDATIAKRDAELADERLEKRAMAEMPNLGDAAVRKSILRAVDGIADAKEREAAIKALRAGSDAIGRLFKASDHKLRDGFDLPATGATGEGAAIETPDSALRKAVEKYQADHKIPTYEQALSKALRSQDAKVSELYAATKN